MSEYIKIIPRYRVDNIKRKERLYRRKTTEQYKNEVKNINPNIEVIGEYVLAKEKILHKCLICNTCWKALSSNILKGHGCPECSKSIIGNKLKKSTEKHIEELCEIRQDIMLVDSYIGANTKTKYKCVRCHYEFLATPANVLSGNNKCPVCFSNYKIKDETLYDILLNKQFPNIIRKSSYINSRSKMEYECMSCGHKWSLKTSSQIFSYKYGCPSCATSINSKKLMKTDEQFNEELSHINDDIITLTSYIGAHEPILAQCLICNYSWRTTPARLLRGDGCPSCSMSHGEIKIKNFLNKNKINYIPQKSFDNLVGIKGGLLSYDFYLPTYNLLIEFQGEQHEKPRNGIFGGEEQFKVQQEHDRRKREYAKENNINLLEIWYYEIDNIEEILINKLNNLKLESLETAISV